MGPIIRRLSSLGITVGLGLAMTSCGSGSGGPSTHPTSTGAGYTSTYPSSPVPPAQVVAQVGSIPITGKMYDHWLAILSAKVKPSGIGAPPGKPFQLDPPAFTACIALIKAGVPKVGASELKSTCAEEYAKVKKSALELLITRDWVKEAAAEANVTIPEAEAENSFKKSLKSGFPTAAAFRKFQEETLQSNQDLLFSIKSRLLAKALLAKFKKEHSKGQSEAEVTTAFEASFQKWKAKTSCQPGYVVKFCSQYSEAQPGAKPEKKSEPKLRSS